MAAKPVVLIVDDEAGVRESVRMVLKDACEPVTVASGEAALDWLAASAHPAVDNLADWLLVSALQLGGASPAAVLSEASEAGITVRIARAEGEKCERCWHYETDIGQHAEHPTLCGRCVAVLAPS